MNPLVDTVRSTAARGWTLLGPVRRRVRARVTVDTRALAALRIALGVILIGDLLHRARYLGLFYTDGGVYPLSAAEATYTQYNGLSLHALSGSLWAQGLLFVVAGLLAVALVFGYRTRLVGLLSLLFLFSLHGRNPAVLNGGDRLLRVLLLVSLVTPLGERWSVDALRRGSARQTVAGFGTAALLVQPIAVFVANAALKHDGEHWYAGNGIEVALRDDSTSILLGDVLVEFPAVLTLLNYGWVTLLAASPVLLLSTVGRPRALAVFAYLGAFAGMALTMAVGLFPFVLAASVLPFLTTPFWDLLARPVPAGWRDRLSTADRPGPLRREPVERRLFGAARSAGYGPLVDSAVAYARSLLTVLGLAALLWIVVFSALDITDRESPVGFPEQLDQQEWGLYAPDPPESYSWYVTAAELSNGSTVDALDGGPVTYDRPPDAAAEYDSFRHRKFLQAVRRSGSGRTGAIADGYRRWACDRATAAYGDGVEIETVTLYRMHQPSPLDGTYEKGPTRSYVFRSGCGG